MSKELFEELNLTIAELRKENQELKEQLKEQIKEYQKAVDKTMSEKIDIENNWNKLKKFLKNTRKENLEWDKEHNCEWKGYNAYSELLNKMQELEQELEQGRDSNE